MINLAVFSVYLLSSYSHHKRQCELKSALIFTQSLRAVQDTVSPAVEHCGIDAAAACSLIKLFPLVENPSRYRSVHARLIPVEVERMETVTRIQILTSQHTTTILFSWLTSSLAWLNVSGSCKLSCC